MQRSFRSADRQKGESEGPERRDSEGRRRMVGVAGAGRAGEGEPDRKRGGDVWCYYFMVEFTDVGGQFFS